jgi:hypothetical protein
VPPVLLNEGILVVMSMAPPTPGPGPACTLAGPLTMSMESALLKLTGAPYPLSLKLSRMPLKNMSAYWPRMRGTAGWPKAASE